MIYLLAAVLYFAAFIHGGRHTMRHLARELGDPNFRPPSWRCVALRILGREPW